MKTFFAPPERLNNKDVYKQVEFVSNNPVIDGVLKAGSGVLAILNTIVLGGNVDFTTSEKMGPIFVLNTSKPKLTLT